MNVALRAGECQFKLDPSAKRGNITREIRGDRLGAGLNDLRAERGFVVGIGAGAFGLEVVAGEVVAEEGEGFVWSVGNLEELAVARRDGALVNKNIHVQNLVPVGRTVEKNGHFLGELVGLREGKGLEHLVESTEAAGKNDKRLGQVGKPVLTHEKVVKLEVERRRDEAVGILLERQPDVEPDGLASGLVGSPVGGLHDAGTSAGGNDEAMAARLQTFRPGGQQEGEPAGVFVVTSHFDGSLGAATAQFAGGSLIQLRLTCGLLFLRSGLDRASVFKQLKLLVSLVESAEACRTVK